MFAALFVAGIAALVMGANNGSQPDIGLLTASFLFLMGISQTGVVFCAMTRLVKAQWSEALLPARRVEHAGVPAVRGGGLPC